MKNFLQFFPFFDKQIKKHLESLRPLLKDHRMFYFFHVNKIDSYKNIEDGGHKEGQKETILR